MHNDTSALDHSLSVNETIRRFPETLAVLNQFGIDTCCGGAESLDEAARSSTVRLEALMTELYAAIGHAVHPLDTGAR